MCTIAQNAIIAIIPTQPHSLFNIILQTPTLVVLFGVRASPRKTAKQSNFAPRPSRPENTAASFNAGLSLRPRVNRETTRSYLRPYPTPQTPGCRIWSDEHDAAKPPQLEQQSASHFACGHPEHTHRTQLRCHPRKAPRLLACIWYQRVVARARRHAFDRRTRARALYI